MLNIKKFTFNPVEVNAFILWDETLECVLIDPACYDPEEENEFRQFIETNKLKPVRLLNTHGHFDHLMGNGFIKKTWGLKSEIHEDDKNLVRNAGSHAMTFGITMSEPPTDVEFFRDGDMISFGNSKLKVIHVPGHSPGGVAFYSEAGQLLISGDILFSGSIGRTDLLMGNYKLLITGIKEKLMVLDDKVKVFCGHGPETTIGDEKRNNPYLK